MDFEKYKLHVSEGEFGKALESLYGDSKETVYHNQVILIRSNYKRVLEKNRQGLLTSEEYRVELNRVGQSILVLLEDIKLGNYEEVAPQKGTEFIIGIDLGDGETCLAYQFLHRSHSPEIFPSSNKTGITPTLVSSRRLGLKKETIIGEEAFHYLDKLTFLELHLKWNPIEDRDQWLIQKEYLKIFFKKYLQLFSDHYPDLSENFEIYLGCPSSWSISARKEYTRLFESIGVENAIHVIPESRAALLDFYTPKTLISGLGEQSILVIDIGSSTVDFTVHQGLSFYEMQLGSGLGLRQVDEKILEYFFEHHENGKAIEASLLENDEKMSCQLYICRLAREIAMGRDVSLILIESIWNTYHGPYLLEMFLNNALEDSRFSSEGQTYAGQFKQLLLDIAQNEAIHPDQILLTGGGAHISVLRTIAEEVFGAIKVNYREDTPFHVARGLTNYGKWRHRVNLYRKDVEVSISQFLLESETQKEIRKFFGNFAKLVYGSITEAAWKRIAYEWKAGNLNLEEKDSLRKYIIQLYKEWFEEEDRAEFIALSNQLNNYVNPKLAEEIKILAARYQFPLDNFKIQVDFRPETLFNFQYSPADILISELAQEMEEIFFKLVDKVPQGVRNLIPRQLLDLSLMIEQGSKQIMGSIAKTLINNNPDKRVDEKLFDFMSEALQKTFDDQFYKVEQLLLIGQKTLQEES